MMNLLENKQPANMRRTPGEEEQTWEDAQRMQQKQ